MVDIKSQDAKIPSIIKKNIESVKEWRNRGEEEDVRRFNQEKSHRKKSVSCPAWRIHLESSFEVAPFSSINPFVNYVNRRGKMMAAGDFLLYKIKKSYKKYIKQSQKQQTNIPIALTQ